MRTTIYSLIFLLLPTYSFCYEIGSNYTDLQKPEFDNHSFGYERNHERMTALALKCLYDHNLNNNEIENKPIKCQNFSPDKETYSIFTDALTSDNQLINYLDLVNHVRWSDDPTRMLISKKTSVKFGALLGADKVKAEKLGIVACSKRANEGEFNLLNHGMLCNSHYGKLQFLHSMAEKRGEEHKDTYSKIVQWSQWSLEMLKSEEVKSEDRHGRNQNYCDYWESSPDKELAQAMTPNLIRSAELCDDTRWFFGFFGHPEWLLSTIFNFTCDGSLSSKECTIFKNNNDHTQKAALGSILHMIQDSYSSSHANRGNELSDPQVNCSEIQSFYSYGLQNHDSHTVSDKWPTFSDECHSIETMDPVTASAQAIWISHKVMNKPDNKFKEHNNKYNSDFDSLIKSVFGKQPLPNIFADAGKAYAK
tara:strand:+ start:18998 stop:20260 length:1263 start_codon:yes stop_codon:yes gene_type:complete